MRFFRVMITMMAACVAISGCASREKRLPKVELAESQLKVRSIQTRSFETTDENRVLRAVVATLQDFGFVIEAADEALGTITATRIDMYSLRTTVTVRSRREGQVLVRMNAYHKRPIREPVIYQDFFTSLAKSMFRSTNPIE